MLLLSTIIKAVALGCYLILEWLNLRSSTPQRLRRLFAVYLFGMIYWQFTSLMVNFSRQPETALLWYSLLVSGSGTFNVLFFPFTRAFLGIRRQRRAALLAYLVAVLLLAAGALRLPFESVYMGRAGYYVPAFTTRIPYVMGSVAYLFWGYGVANLIRGLVRQRSAFQRNRIKYVLLGAGIVIVGAASNFTLLRDYPVDITANLIGALVMGYAVVRHRLLAIRVVLLRSLFYSLLTGLVIAIYIGAVLGLQALARQGFGYTSPVYAVLAIIVLSAVFLPLRNLMQRQLDRLFFRERYDYQKVLQAFSASAVSIYDPEQMLGLIERTVRQTMQVDRVFIMLHEREGRTFRIRRACGIEPEVAERLSLADGSPLADWLRRHQAPLLREEAGLAAELAELIATHSLLFEQCPVLAPILLKDQLIGLLGVGEKLSGAIYSEEDLRFLNTVANQAATSIDNATAYQEVERRLSEQTLLFILSETFRRTVDVDEVMSSVVRVLRNFLSFEQCLLVYFDIAGNCRTYGGDPLSTALGETIRDWHRSVDRKSWERAELTYQLPGELTDRLAMREDLRAEEVQLASSFVCLPLRHGEEVLGVLLVPNRTGTRPVERRELELLRTVRSIVGQGITLHRTIADLVQVKNYNENILKSVDEMGDSLMIVDPHGRIRRVNRATCALLGYSEAELKGEHVRLVLPDGDNPFSGQGFKRLLREGLAGREATYRDRSGRRIPMLLSGSPIRGEDGRVEGVVALARDLSEHKRAEEASKNLLLIKEIHHRIKNNLQVISSLIYLQSMYVEGEEVKELFRESQNRVRSMALIHEKLYQTRDSSGFSFAEYIRELADNLLNSYSVSAVPVSLEIDAEDIVLNMDTAVPVGLIVNELVTNSLKHAFTGKSEGRISITLRRLKNGEKASGAGGALQLVVADDGRGFPAKVDFRTTRSLGLQLVCTLTDQLEGTIDLCREGGSRFTLSFQER